MPASQCWRYFPIHPTICAIENGAEVYNPDNLICRALSVIKNAISEIRLIADVALDEYSSDGQDGLVQNGEILNDETVKVMIKSALVQSRAGAIHHLAFRHDGWPCRRGLRRA